MEILLYLALGLVVFYLIWILVCFVISRAGGWSKLAEEYKFPQDPYAPWEPLETLAWRSVLLGRSGNYKNCVTINVTEEGLLLQPSFLFKKFHPPLYLPWESLDDVSFQEGWFRGMRFWVSGNPVLIRGDSGEILFAEWRRRRGEIAAPVKRLENDPD
jgi:hypothetical protein